MAVPTLDPAELALRLVLAAVLGGVIGFEREVRDHEAGLRTHVLVAVGSALFTIVSAFGFEDFLSAGPTIRADPARIAAQIVAGVGFLGAGVIFRQGALIRGLTTAATLWAVAAIGLAAGAGLYTASVLTTALVLAALWPLKTLMRHLRRNDTERAVNATIPASARLDETLAALRSLGIDADLISLHQPEPDTGDLQLTVAVPARRTGIEVSVRAVLARCGATFGPDLLLQRRSQS